MNFEYILEAEWHYGFYAVVGLCTALGISMLYYLRRNGMF